MNIDNLTPVQAAILNGEEILKERFLIDGSFNAVRFVDDVLAAFPSGYWKTPMNDKGGETIYTYNEEKGIFEDTGIPFIEQRLAQILGEDCKNSYYGRVVKHLQVKTYVEPRQFEPDPNVIVLQNGTYHIKDRILTPHSAMFNQRAALPVTYDPEAKCPLNIKFLKEIIPKYVEFWQEWLGYHLIKSYIWQRIVVLVGDGDNGKSTLLKVQIAFLGDENVSKQTLYRLSTNRFAAAELRNKLANIAADIGPDEIKHTGVLKMLSGNDWMDVERKNRDPESMKNHAKLTFSCNQLPQTPDESLAFFKRFIPILFEKVIQKHEQDTKLIEKLTTTEELSGLFNWAVEGLYRALERGRLQEPEDLEERRELYLAMSDPVTGFIRDVVIQDPEAEIEKDKVYQAFVDYCKSKAFIPKSKNKFFEQFKTDVWYRESQSSVDGLRVRILKGVALPEPAQAAQDARANNTSNEKLDNFQGKEDNTCAACATRAEEAP